MILLLKLIINNWFGYNIRKENKKMAAAGFEPLVIISEVWGH
jgi:hypothetical protein